MIGSRMLGLAALAIAWAAPASAQTITLDPGQAVTVTFDGKDARFSDDGEAVLTPYDAHAVEQLRGATKSGQLGYQMLQGSDESPPVIVPDTVHMRFVVADGESVLMLDNGFNRGFVYRAKMTLDDGRVLATDTCLVQPGRPNYEYWPHGIVRLELTAFALVPWKTGDKVPCV